MKIIRTQSKIAETKVSNPSSNPKTAKKKTKKKSDKKLLAPKAENNSEQIENKKEPITELDEEIKWRDEEIGNLFKKARKKKTKRGQPTKLSEDIIRDMEVLARIGIGKNAICDSVGIVYQTYDNWMQENEDFAYRMHRARNKGKTVLLNSIFGAGKRNWQAHAWLLERQYRSEFGAPDKTKLEVTGKDETPLYPVQPPTVIIEYVGNNNSTNADSNS